MQMLASPPCCQEGAPCRTWFDKPSKHTSGSVSSTAAKGRQLCLQRSPRNRNLLHSVTQFPQCRAESRLRCKLVIFKICCLRVDCVEEGQVGLRSSRSCRAHDEEKRDYGEALAEPMCGDPGEGGKGNGKEGGGGGTYSWHWESDWGNKGDEGNSRFLEAYFFSLLGFLNKNATKLLMPTIVLLLYFQRDMLANADAVVSSFKAFQVPDENGDSKNDSEKEGQSPTCDGQTEPDAVFEVQGGTWTRILIDYEKDEFIIDPVKESKRDAFSKDQHGSDIRDRPFEVISLSRATKQCLDFLKSVLLPDGYPECVTADYFDYTIWRMIQTIASQINGVLTTQALLYAVGLGKGAIPTAAALNWVLKDGIGYLGKIVLASYGRHFDVHPKGWRLVADLLENASYALELLTPMYPHLFVYLGAAAGAGRSASGLIQAATRSCFYAGFAAQRNFAEVIAKGEAQGMVSKFLGIALGIAVSAYVGASGPALVTTFLTVTSVHMICNVKSYQAVQLRTLNPYRACLVFGEYIRGSVVASVEEVNAAEPFFSEVPFLLPKHKKKIAVNLLSSQTKENARVIAGKLKLGVSFPSVIRSQAEALELFEIYDNEQYILVKRHNTYQALLREGATSHDLLKLVLQACYIHQLQSGSADASDSYFDTSVLRASHKLAEDNLNMLKQKLVSAGWSLSDGLIARPLPYRLMVASV
ncbi:hypothetical protein KP509_11G021800 [Ceratopteris richardii]|uniref:Uncharacterized protein n=1 Tax=Ceratopteris richardii TaxID=49495 RepID=A0A8T2TQK5_CERRI|nr:hypothetical protein KP509_11G021800 [Ceratopteris richardii]